MVYKKRSSAAIFSVVGRSQMTQNEISAKFQKNIGTLGCGECRLVQYFNFRLELVILKLNSTCPKEHFEQIFCVENFSVDAGTFGQSPEKSLLSESMIFFS